MYVVVNNTVIVDVGQDIIVGEGVQVTTDCTQLINDVTNSGVRNLTVNWYKDGVNLATRSAPNVVLSNNDKFCIITSTSLPVGGQNGTSGNYTCEVCNTANCTSKMSTHTVCGKKDYFNNYIHTYILLCI